MAARRMKKKTTRRRRAQGINIINTAQSLVVANAGTKAFFGTDLLPFLTEGWLVNKTSSTDNSWELSMAEIVQRLAGGTTGGMSPSWDQQGIMGAIKYNIRNNPGALVTIVAAPAAFNVAKKLTAKPRRDANKLLKMAGLNTVVKV